VPCATGFGQRGGEALAEALFGLVPFSGRLPVTVVADTTQLPPYMVQRLSQPPGRTHRYLTSEPLFSFGFGMTSHAAARYTSLQVAPATIAANAQVDVNITVRVQISSLPVARRAPPPVDGEQSDGSARRNQLASLATASVGLVASNTTTNGSCTFQTDMDYDQSNTPCFPRQTKADCCSLCLQTAGCVAFSFHAGLRCPGDSSVVGSRCWLKPTTAGLRHLKGCVAGLCHGHPPAPPTPVPAPLPPPSTTPQQDEVVQVYFGWVGGDRREDGESSVPLHQLVAFRRVQLPPPTSATVLRVQFDVTVGSLHLMNANGTMGLLPGQWKVWVGGTSPRTPKSLLRGGSGGDGTQDGAPQAPLVAQWMVTSARP
jgi:hypothetical protein